MDRASDTTLPMTSSMVTEEHHHPVDETFDGAYTSYWIDGGNTASVHDFTKVNQQKFYDVINKHEKQPTKITAIFHTVFYHERTDTQSDQLVTSLPKTIVTGEDRDRYLSNLDRDLLRQIVNLHFRNSQWRLLYVKGLELRIYAYQPLGGGTGDAIPPKYKKGRALIQIRPLCQNDNKCFKWAMLAKYCEERYVKYAKQLTKHEDKYKWCSFPMTLADLDSFEKKNPGTSVNVYGVDESTNLYPMRISPNHTADHNNLLYYNNHFTYIKSLKALVSAEKKYKYVCTKCLLLYTVKKDYDKHLYLCAGYFFSKLPNAVTSLPKEIIKKSALEIPGGLAPENSFRHAVLAGMRPKYVDLSDYDRLVTINEVALFEKQNPQIAINVYTTGEKSKIYPLYITKNTSVLAREIHLFYYDVNESYYFIRDLSRLVRSQITRYKRGIYICPRCLSHFYSEWRLKTHKSMCVENPVARVYVPHKGANILTFTKFKYKIKVPITMYFDFETTLKPIDERPNSSTQLYARHEPNSFCLHVINEYEPATMPRVYCGERAVETFFEYLIEEAEKAMEYMGQYTPYDPDKAIEYNPKKCHICELPISPSEIPVVDHWHQAEGGTIRGYAHNSCNLNYQQPNYITIYAHNAAKYDQKLILKHMNSVQGSITAIARSDEEFITISKNYSNGFTSVRLRFVDSYKMLSGSLENLVQNMGGERDLFIQTRKIIPDHLLHLAMRKSVFPYSYITSEAVFDETELPPIGAFFNDLSKEPCSPENYKHAQECWTAFGMKTLGDYNRFYVMLDTLLLSDVISAYRKTAQLSHGLDPAHFISNASYTWSCMLWHSRQKIELLTDIDQYYTFKNNIRGGYCVCSLRYARANNPDVNPNFNPKTEVPSYLFMTDFNALYSKAMCESLPLKNFKWMSRDELDYVERNILDISDNAETGYWLVADIEYPPELHMLHSRIMPVLPENIIPPGGKVPKLVANLRDKTNYGLHYRALKMAVSLGLKIKSIRRGISFHQEPWLQGYIQKNMELRRRAKNDFDKQLYKDFCNMLFGRTCMDVGKHKNVRLITEKGKFLKAVADPYFERATMIGEEIVAVHKTKKSIRYDFPIYIGASVLDISKTYMQDFLYNHVNKNFGETWQLCYSDTDSALIFSEGVNPSHVVKLENQKGPMSWYDCSEYDPSHMCYTDVNKRVPGKMKNEYPKTDIIEFCGVRPKAYSILTTTDNKRKLKGIKSHVIRKQITHQDYLDCLYQNKRFQHKQNTIISKKQRIYSAIMTKTSLDSYDSKVHVWPDNVHTFPHFHVSVMTHQNFMKALIPEIHQQRSSTVGYEHGDSDVEMLDASEL